MPMDNFFCMQVLKSECELSHNISDLFVFKRFQFILVRNQLASFAVLCYVIYVVFILEGPQRLFDKRMISMRYFLFEIEHLKGVEVK